jgi:DDE family transposase
MQMVMPILILFHQSHYRHFKAFYTEHVMAHLRREFPGLLSYGRFIEFIPSTLLPCCAYFRVCGGTCTGISFVDSTVVAVCHNRRIARHKVFAERVARGTHSVGWFFGFKLHWVFNDRGEILSVRLTPGKVDDRKPVPPLVKDLFGRLFGDKGYVSRHGSPFNFLVNVLCGLTAYCHQPKKPSFHLDGLLQLPA